MENHGGFSASNQRASVEPEGKVGRSTNIERFDQIGGERIMSEFGGRLDRWLHPDDPMMCKCEEEMTDERCLNPECDEYEEPERPEDEEDE
jgi:hypothetical protein